MTTTSLSTLALAIGLFAAASAWAESRMIGGTVAAKDIANDTVVVETDTGARMLFHTLPTTILKRKDGSVLPMTSVEVGDRVEISTEPTTSDIATQLIVIVPVANGIVTGPGVDRVNQQTDNTGKASGYRPSQQVPADAD